MHGPFPDLFRRPVGVAVVVVAVAIAFVQPLLVVAFQLIVEDDPLNAGAAVQEGFCFALVGAIDLEVVLQFPLASDASVEGLRVPAVRLVLQQAPALLRESDHMLAIAGHPSGFDEPLFAKMPQVARARIARPIAMVPKVTTGDDPKHTDCRQGAGLGPAEGVLATAIGDDFPLETSRQV